MEGYPVAFGVYPGNMCITIEVPQTYKPEREYIMHVVFREFLSIDYRIEFSECKNTTLKLPNDKTIVFFDSLFGVDEKIWLTEQSLPRVPLSWFDSSASSVSLNLVDSIVPVIYGDPSVNICAENNSIDCRIDMFGSMFFMLSRYEEYVLPVKDMHNRFPGSESLAFKAGFLGEPIVNSYLELLWELMKNQCPWLKRKQHRFLVYPTHDVDRPFEYYVLSLQRIMRIAAADCLRRKSVWRAVSNVYQWGLSKLTDGVKDVNNTFEYLMETSEKRGLVSRFYFLASTSGKDDYFDRSYKITDPIISRLMVSISSRGHEIGLHTSYDTYLSEELTRAEMQHLKSHCNSLNIDQAVWGVRQHYLRWSNPDTQLNLSRCGLDYDSTMGFADMAGFRCGTCYEYSLYDLVGRKMLNLQERPLIAMDSVFMADIREHHQTIDDCYDELCRLKKKCQVYGGEFTLLWHNSSLEEVEYRRLYEAVLDA